MTAVPAQASVTPYGEPAYTKTSTNNTFWWQWQAVDGLNLDTNQKTYMWWMCYRSKGGRIVAKKGIAFSSAGTYAAKLRVSKRLKAGTYRLRLSFTPRGSDRAVTRRLTLKVIRPKSAHRASRATSAPLRGTATRTGRAPGSR
jgi:hypothetical protein